MPRGKKSDDASQQNVDELRKKLMLMEGDKRAYFETATYTMKQNAQKIQDLRKEVQELNQRRADRRAADEEVVAKGLEDHPVERNALRNKPGTEAIRHMDEKCCDLKNKLNKMKYVTSKKQRQLEELKTQSEQMEKDHKDAVETAKGESEDAQKLRNLENRLDKANLKCREAEHIQNTYIQIKAKLEQEHSTFNTTLDDMEEAIKRDKGEKEELEAMNRDAMLARDAAKEEFERQEKEIYAERQQRERELQAMRKQAEETRLQNEKNERRIAGRAASVQQEDTQTEHQAIAGEDEQQKITKYEDMFKKIKEATGVSDTQEVVTRFEYQEETTEQLEQLKVSNEKQISRLREDKEKHQQEFEEMKYTGEAKMSSGQRLLEEFQAHLTEEQMRQYATEDTLDKNSRILTNIKTGMDHLAKKLKQVKAPQSQVQKANVSPASDEHVLDQLSQCEEKLMKLMEELDSSGKSVDDIVKDMEEEEFHNTAESRLPTYNTRVPLKTTQRDAMYEVDSDSGDEEAILTRAQIKRQSQMMLDSKNKRRMGVGRRKKKNK